MTYDIKKVVEVDFDEVIGMTIDNFNEHLCDLTGEPSLHGIAWEAFGFDDGLLMLEVSGFIDEEE
jgi:hypothetical protein